MGNVSISEHRGVSFSGATLRRRMTSNLILRVRGEEREEEYSLTERAVPLSFGISEPTMP